MNEQLHATVSGRVQGVSFRYYTLRQAQSLQLTGWVRNRSDGTVEVVAEGSRTALDKLLEFLHEGSPAAVVAHVDIEFLAATNSYNGFSITR